MKVEEFLTAQLVLLVVSFFLGIMLFRIPNHGIRMIGRLLISIFSTYVILLAEIAISTRNSLGIYQVGLYIAILAVQVYIIDETVNDYEDSWVEYKAWSTYTARIIALICMLITACKLILLFLPNL